MKAFVKVRPEPGGTEYLDWEVPSIQAGEVLIQVKVAGLCGTDIHLYDWPDTIVREYRPTPLNLSISERCPKNLDIFDDF